jgi:hypothetical protein
MGRAMIYEFGITVTGNLVRKFDQGANETVLTVTIEQARELRESLDLVLDFVDAQANTQEDPDG